MKETDESFIYIIKTKWLDQIQKLKKEIDFSNESTKDESDINNFIEEINICLSEVESSTSNETLINSGILNNECDLYENNYIYHHRNSRYLSGNLFQKKKTIDIIKQQTRVKHFELFQDCEERDQSDSLGVYPDSEIINDSFVFAISKNKGDSNSNNNLSNSNENHKVNEFDCVDNKTSEFIVSKNREDKNSLNLISSNSSENKEGSTNKLSKISKIIIDNLNENSFSNHNDNNHNNFNLGIRNNLNPNFIQIGNMKNDDSQKNFSSTKNNINNLKNSCKFFFNFF